MKNSIATLILCFCWIQAALTQQASTVIPPQKKHVLIGTSISVQWLNQTIKSGSVHVEVPVDEYRNLCLQVSKTYGNDAQYYDYDGQELKSGFEVGVAGKFFLHGRFTGHRSGFFIGPDIRFGTRNYNILIYDPATFGYKYVANSIKHTKWMFTWGMQWYLGKHTVFSISAPLGYETVSGKEMTNIYGGTYPVDNSFAIVPTLMLGIAF